MAKTYIEIVEHDDPPVGGQPFHWRFNKNGRITASAETFPTKSNAIRAAKAVVVGIAKEFGVMSESVLFQEEKLPKGHPEVVVRFSF